MTKRKESLVKGARKEFMERYHQWAFTDARREVHEDFRLVRRVRNQTAYRFLEMVEPMAKEEQLRLMTALVKRYHKAGLAPVPEDITPEDEGLIKRYREYDHGEIIPGIRARLPIIRDGRHKRIREVGEGLKTPKIDLKRLRKAIVERLRGTCGDKITHYDAGSFYFETRICSWNVRTELNTSSRSRLSYFHRLVIPTWEIIVGEGISLFHWLGLTGGTNWELEDDSQIDEMIESLTMICRHFLEETGALLEGFAPPALGKR
jgi:hypothetical protein